MNKGLAFIILGLWLLSVSQGVSAQKVESMEYTRLSCAELYVLATQLEPGSQHHRSPLYNEKTNVIATALGSVTKLGYYYFGLSVAREYVEDYRIHGYRQELDRVRQYMAQQYCFQKS